MQLFGWVMLACLAQLSLVKNIPPLAFIFLSRRLLHIAYIVDPTDKVSSENLRAATQLSCHTDPKVLLEADFIVEVVPTPVEPAGLHAADKSL